MPELPEVEAARALLDRHLPGKTISSVLGETDEKIMAGGLTVQKVKTIHTAYVWIQLSTQVSPRISDLCYFVWCADPRVSGRSERNGDREEREGFLAELCQRDWRQCISSDSSWDDWCSSYSWAKRGDVRKWRKIVGRLASALLQVAT